MRPHAVIAAGLVVLAAGALAPPLPAEEPITVVAAEFPPLTTDAGGRPGGIVLDALREAGKRAGIPLRFSFLPWERAKREVLENPRELIIPFTRTPGRELSYQWVAPVVGFDTVLITLDAPLTSLDAARQRVVGYVRGTSFTDEAREAGFTHVEESIDDATNARKLKSGHIQAWITTDLMAGAVYREAGFDPGELKYGMKLGETKISYVAASPDFPPAIAEKIADALAAMRADGTLEAIVKRYL